MPHKQAVVRRTITLGYSGSIRPLVQWTMLRREHLSGEAAAGEESQPVQVELFVGSRDSTEGGRGNTETAWFAVACLVAA